MMKIIGQLMLIIPAALALLLILVCTISIGIKEFRKAPKENTISIAIAVGVFTWITIASELINRGG